MPMSGSIHFVQPHHLQTSQLSSLRESHRTSPRSYLHHKCLATITGFVLLWHVVTDQTSIHNNIVWLILKRSTAPFTASINCSFIFHLLSSVMEWWNTLMPVRWKDSFTVVAGRLCSMLSTDAMVITMPRIHEGQNPFQGGTAGTWGSTICAEIPNNYGHRRCWD